MMFVWLLRNVTIHKGKQNFVMLIIYRYAVILWLACEFVLQTSRCGTLLPFVYRDGVSEES
jgi:hypothetical protein